MKKLMLLVLYSTLATAEIRLHEGTGVVQSPAGCLKKTGSCLITASRPGWKTSLGIAEIQLAKGATIERISGDEWRQVDGLAKLRCATGEEIHSAFGKILCADEGFILIKRSKAEWQIVNLTSNLRITPRGYQAPLNLPSGYELKIGLPLADGNMEISFPSVYDWEWSTKVLLEFDRDDRQHLLTLIETMRPHWREARRVAGEIAQTEAERAIANHASEVERARIERIRADAENRQLRELFRRKNYLD